MGSSDKPPANHFTDLNATIECDRKAIDLALQDGRPRATLSGNFGLNRKARHPVAPNLLEFEWSIEYDRQVLRLIPSDGAHDAKYLLNTAIEYKHRYMKTKGLSDMETVYHYHRLALKAATVYASGSYNKLLFSLAMTLRQAYRVSKQVNDLKNCIFYGEKALEALPMKEYWKCLRLLGAAWGDLFKVTDDLEASDESVRYYKHFRTGENIDAASRILALGELGLAYRNRFAKTARLADLDCCIQYVKEAYESIPVNHTIQRGKHLADVGAGFWYRFEWTSESEDLEQFIQYGQQALDHIPLDDPDYKVYLCRLAIGSQERYRRTNHAIDLERSIECYLQIPHPFLVDDDDCPIYWGCLGHAYGLRFGRTGQVADLDESIICHRRAVDAVSADHADRSSVLSHLAHTLGIKYEQSARLDDLEDYIAYARQAVGSAPVGHPDRSGSLSILYYALKGRFDRLGQMDDLELSIEYASEAVETLPEDIPQIARCYFNLGQALEARFRKTSASEDLQRYIEAYQKAASLRTAYPLVRIAATTFVVDALVELQKWTAAADMLSDALSMISETVLPTNSRDDMQDTLEGLSGLASISASVFLKAGKSPWDALQALEKCRGLISNFLIEARSNTLILEQKQPQLWSRYKNCLRQIADIDAKFELGLQTDLQQNYTVKSAQRQQLYQSLESLRNEIRQCPGFERFLLPFTEVELRDLAQAGPIVCYNTSHVSSEAFLITKTGVRALPLPNLRIEDIRRQVKLFEARGNAARRDGTVCMDDEDEPLPAPDSKGELEYLWNNAVKPVLQEAGLLNQTPTGKLARIWWVVSGLFALLPLHATGNHAPGSLQNTLSHVVSSYAPTLRSLQFIQSSCSSFSFQAQEKLKILVVSMPTTPGSYAALNVAEEVALIKNHAGPRASFTYLERPNRDDVLEALKSCHIAHFACHGIVDARDPAQSALIVGKGDLEQRLTVADLDKVVADLSNARIVYLSACSTAEIQALDLAQESIHLANAFQLSGFKHVIGTLWGADDGAAVRIAGEFYRNLLQHPGEEDAGEDGKLEVARALHDATCSFRSEGTNWSNVSQWAAFIHLGW